MESGRVDVEKGRVRMVSRSWIPFGERGNDMSR